MRPLEIGEIERVAGGTGFDWDNYDNPTYIDEWTQFYGANSWMSDGLWHQQDNNGSGTGAHTRTTMHRDENGQVDGLRVEVDEDGDGDYDYTVTITDDSIFGTVTMNGNVDVGVGFDDGMPTVTLRWKF
jgi:hypothetical protein